LMCRLGLRCGEVAALRLEDIDWVAGTVTIHGKGNRIDRMPLDLGYSRRRLRSWFEGCRNSEKCP